MLSAIIFDHLVRNQIANSLCISHKKLFLMPSSGPVQAIDLKFSVRDHVVTKNLPPFK